MVLGNQTYTDIGCTSAKSSINKIITKIMPLTPPGIGSSTSQLPPKCQYGSVVRISARMFLRATIPELKHSTIIK